MESRSVESAPAGQPRSVFTVFEVSSADDDLVHLVAEDDLVEGITAGEGWYRAVSGERVTAHAFAATTTNPE